MYKEWEVAVTQIIILGLLTGFTVAILYMIFIDRQDLEDVDPKLIFPQMRWALPRTRPTKFNDQKIYNLVPVNDLKSGKEKDKQKTGENQITISWLWFEQTTVDISAQLQSIDECQQSSKINIVWRSFHWQYSSSCLEIWQVNIWKKL